MTFQLLPQKRFYRKNTNRLNVTKKCIHILCFNNFCSYILCVIFGKIATDKNFTDREKETADLVQNFMSLINTIIISPRRWGKSSLVNKPFYKFGNLMFLNKIETPCLVEFFKSRFADTGKNINDEASHLIAKLVDNHPYYAQQLAQLSWLRTKDVCTVEIVREAHTALVEQLSLLFVTITETLTTQQLNYLKALIAGEISFQDPIYAYWLKTEYFAK